MNLSIMNVSLPVISRQFVSTVSFTEMLVTLYFISYIGFITLFMKIAKYKGYERLFISGIVLFLISSVLCIVSSSIDFLLFSRFVQGIGGSMILTGSLVMLNDDFNTKILKRTRRIFSLMIFIGFATGPSVGGLMQYMGWRSIFLLDVFLSVVLLLLSYRYYKFDENKPLHADVFNGFLVFLITLLVVYILYLADMGKHIETIILIIVITIILAVMLYVEKQDPDSKTRMKLLKNHTFVLLNIALQTMYIYQYVLLFIIPIFTIEILGVSSAKACRILLIAPLTLIIFTIISRKISEKTGTVNTIITGILLVGISLALMLTLNKSSNISEVLEYYALMNIGITFIQAPVNNVLMNIASIKQNRTSVNTASTIFRTITVIIAVRSGRLLLSSTSHGGLFVFNSQMFDVNGFIGGMNNIIIGGIIVLLVLLILMIYIKIKARKSHSFTKLINY